MGTADLLVRLRNRDLLRLRHLQFETRSAQNRRRDRLVPCAENRRRHLDCIRLARLHSLAGALSHGIHPRTARYRYRPRWVRARVEPGRPTKFGCPGFRSHECTALDDVMETPANPKK